MPMTPDEALSELLAITRQLDDVAPTTRSERSSKPDAKSYGRRPRGCAVEPQPRQCPGELAHLRRRLAALDAETVKTPSWQAHLPARINDPDAPARLINRRIDELNEPQRQELEARIAELEAQLGETK